MIRKYYITLLLAGLVTSAFTQQLSQKTQFYLNRLSFNPAVAGTVDHIPIMINVRQQWVGIEDAPAAQTFSAHAFTGKGMGLGVLLYNDVAGPSRNTGFNFSAARHFPLSKTGRNEHSWISVGMAGLLYNYFIDAEKLVTDPDEIQNDPAVQRLLEQNSRLSADISFGVYVTHRAFFVGLSAINLIESKQDIFTEQTLNNNLKRTYYALGGYKHPLTDVFSIEPSFLVKGAESGVFQADILLKGYYQKHYLGISYRTSDAMAAMVGFNVKNYFQFAYSYDLTLSDLNDYNNGTHEVSVVLNIFEPISREGRVVKERERPKRKKRKY